MLARLAHNSAALFGAALFALYALIPSPWGTNQISRFEITKAVALHGTVALPGIEKRTIDWAVRDGHYYSNKAPGSSFVAVPFVFAAALVERALGFDPDALDELHHKITDVFSTALPAALLGALLLAWLGALPGAGDRRWGTALAFALGSIAFPYSLSIWGHQTAASFLFGAFFLLTRRGNRAGAGFCFAFAVLSDYTCAVAAPAFVYLLVQGGGRSARDRVEALVRFGLGGLAPFVVFAAYHTICFGAWYRLPTSFYNPNFLEPAGGGGGVLAIPRAGALFNLLFGSDRGFFVLSPVFLVLPLGLYRWARSGEQRAEGIACLWVCFAIWAFAASFNGWWGGCCVGPRYLIPAIPFLAVFLQWAPQGWWFRALLAYSVFNMVAVSVGEVHLCVNRWVLWSQVYPTATHEPVRFAGIACAAAAACAITVALAKHARSHTR